MNTLRALLKIVFGQTLRADFDELIAERDVAREKRRCATRDFRLTLNRVIQQVDAQGTNGTRN